MNKSQQLQIRVSPQEKAEIKRRAAESGMEVSNWVLAQLLPARQSRFQTFCRELARAGDGYGFVFAEFSDFLSSLSSRALSEAVAEAPQVQLPVFEANYLAAMIEHAAANKRIVPPEWLFEIRPLDKPWFASSLNSLRLHLLTSSPPAFRRRNLFIDSSLESRV